VKVICPKCKAENQLPDMLDRKTIYKCDVCENRLTRISKTDYGKVAAFMVIAWLVIPIIVWIAVLLAKDVSEYSFEYFLVGNGFMLSILIGIINIFIIAFLLWRGLKHKRFTGFSPQSFQRFVFVSVLCACTCFAASGLAFAWWKWWA
jgi:uncharacterized protein (DUF983 family)